MPLPDLLKAVRKPHSAGDRSNAAGIAINDAELEWLGSFHENIRNQFVHFAPTGWSIEASGIPTLAALIARIIGDILAAGYGFRHFTETQCDQMQGNIKRLTSGSWIA